MPEIYDRYELPEGTFLLSLNIIDRYQQEDPILLEKLNSAEYQKGYFCIGRNTIEVVMHKNKIVIAQKLQKYAVQWYHTYLLNPILYRMEAMICQYLYWTGIREDFQKKVTTRDIFHPTKR